ncbi:hypothetical protein GJ744_004868 [Endocarpon pusillum]|uniref:Uncharacterized protein n=1 Tax=Endocarpon pusillum TaxID=364733 RepID=A0A8H7E7Q8_9EURO|nr:hypothetical protein GJ744_004868 [Endocarpon pusillum]
MYFLSLPVGPACPRDGTPLKVELPWSNIMEMCVGRIQGGRGKPVLAAVIKHHDAVVSLVHLSSR